jgi:predicted RNase H-like HicB family nuclease
MAVKKYVVLIEKGERSYGAYVPDLPGCAAAGKTAAEARRLIREAIELHIEGTLRDGDTVPASTTQAYEVEIDMKRITVLAKEEAKP